MVLKVKQFYPYVRYEGHHHHQKKFCPFQKMEQRKIGYCIAGHMSGSTSICIPVRTSHFIHTYNSKGLRNFILCLSIVISVPTLLSTVVLFATDLTVYVDMKRRWWVIWSITILLYLRNMSSIFLFVREVLPFTLLFPCCWPKGRNPRPES